MFRYLGHILIVVMALALATGLALLLVGGLTERLVAATRADVIALDSVQPAGVPATRAWLAIDRGGLFRRRWVTLLVRFDGGPRGLGYAGRTGIGYAYLKTGLPEGRHPFAASFLDVTPMAGLDARGAVWVRPKDRSMLWLDSEALLAGGEAGAEALESVRSLARAYAVVYVVGGDGRDYVRADRRLAEAGFPAGPRIWVAEPRAQEMLRVLRASGPVAAVVVGGTALGEQVRALQMPAPIYQLSASGPQTAADWQRIRRELGAGDAAAPTEPEG